MIRYALACEKDHAFESWFQSSAAYDSLLKAGHVTCPVCGSAKVSKQLMAPAISTSRRKEARPAAVDQAVEHAATAPPIPAAPPVPAPERMMTEQDAKLRAMLRELHAHVKATTEDVGAGFADQARRMHAGEIDHKPIRGVTTFDEAKALHEEGVPVAPLPPLPEERN
jgi:hypothetical protein